MIAQPHDKERDGPEIVVGDPGAPNL